MDRMVSTSVAAERLGVKTETVRTLIRHGVLLGGRRPNAGPSGRKCWFVWQSSLDEYCRRAGEVEEKYRQQDQ